MSSVEQKIAELLEESRKRSIQEQQESYEEESLGAASSATLEEESEVDDVSSLAEESEDLDRMLDGLFEEELSEEFKNKVRVVFESAVRRRAMDIVAEAKAEMAEAVSTAKVESESSIDEATSQLSEAIAEAKGEINESFDQAKDQINEALVEASKQVADQLREQSEVIAAALEENVDKYLTYAVNEWVEENRIALESSVRSELVENFIHGLKGLFEQHYIDIPEEKVDVLGSLQEANSTLKARLNTQISANATLKKQLEEEKILNATNRLAEGLTGLDKERFLGLVESINYGDFDSFEEKASIIRESYFNKAPKKRIASSTMITESELSYSDLLTERDDGMQKYTNLLDNL